MNFQLGVHKCKCKHCDTIVLVERNNCVDTRFSCPACEREMSFMENIDVKQEYKYEKVRERLHKKKEKSFEDIYKEYKNTFDSMANGLVETDKQDFLKMFAFYTSITQPAFLELWETYLGKNTKS